jgi:hypothetical protein
VVLQCVTLAAAPAAANEASASNGTESQHRHSLNSVLSRVHVQRTTTSLSLSIRELEFENVTETALIFSVDEVLAL